MLNLAPPTSQKASVRPISFMLVDPTTPQVVSQATTITLSIRPEDLTRTDPSRLNVRQTLAGLAWQDNFGPGIPSIVINGHTGWHRSQEGTQTPDGLDRWLALRKLVFDDWHSRKQNAIIAGRDPDKIQLIFADKLDNFACVVAPPSITLRRNRARPLLYQYQIAMTVLDQNINPPSTTQAALSAADQQAAALAAVKISTDRFIASETTVKTVVDPLLASKLSTFINKSVSLFLQVSSDIVSGTVAANSIITIAHSAAKVGASVFQSLAAVTNGTFEKALVMQVGAEFSNMVCLFSNAFNQQRFYEDYTALYGASNCSSTNGGDAPSIYAESNPFLDVSPPTPPSPVTLSQSALTAMQATAANDLVLSPFSTAQLSSYLTAINAGLSLPPNTQAGASTGTTVFSKPLNGYRFVDTFFGDTLQKIAARELGDAAQWGLLIAYNKLIPPYLTDDPDDVVPGVLLTGSQILVPAGAPVISTTTDPNLVFEVDLVLVNGLLQGSNGDFATVAGRDNFKQALKNNVETEQGELLWHTSYGSLCRRMIGAVNGPTQALLTESYAKASLLTDPRVSEVDQATAIVNGDVLQLQLEVIPIVGRPIQLTASP